MNSQLLNLRIILDLEKWIKIQDEIAAVTGMAIITVDYKGVPATKHSRRSDFCTALRTNPETAKYCQKCDSRGGLEAARINKPYIYRCHCNIVDLAVPIIIDEKYIGAIMAGQVLLKCKKEESELERISVSPEDVVQGDEQLKAYYNKLPRLSLDRVTSIASMLQCLTNYIVEEAINKNLLLEMIGKISKNTGEISMENVSGYPGDILLSIKEKMFANRTDKAEDGIVMPQNPTLRPAIEYIANHENESVTLNQMAKLCHTSPGYLSRLFKKEMGESFSDYVSNLKIRLSKNMLEKTDLSITEISNNLGFSDAGYFIKRFKKHEGVTPALFRKYLK